MEFRVLGRWRSVAMARSSRSVPGAGRTLLAVLLLDAGQLVTVDELIELSWAEDPPAHFRA